MASRRKKTAERGRRDYSRLKIKLLVKENPRRPGSNAFKRFDTLLQAAAKGKKQPIARDVFAKAKGAAEYRPVDGLKDMREGRVAFVRAG